MIQRSVKKRAYANKLLQNMMKKIEEQGAFIKRQQLEIEALTKSINENEVKHLEAFKDLKNQIRGRNIKDELTVLWQMQRVRALHSTVFPRFKNINAGKDVVIVTTGPSLNDYQFIDGAIHIGVNKSFKAENINLDYLFMQDYVATHNYIEESFPYKNEKLIRFYGIEPYDKAPRFIIPESVAIRHGALRYYTHPTVADSPELPDCFGFDLTSEELYGKGSTVFAAINFALWTNPKCIYLVGCDCSELGHFYAMDNTIACQTLIQHYTLLKKFVSEHYPETEIISINPVGLKGMFKDIYTI